MTSGTSSNDLPSLLRLVDEIYGIDRVLADRGKDVVKEYYDQSARAFDVAYPGSGCMHLAVDPEGEFTFNGYRHQPRAIVSEANRLGAKRVLELGCGQGFNTLILAQRFPEAEVLGVDLVDTNLKKARAAASKANRPKLRYDVGDLNALVDTTEGFDLVFAVEALSYARDVDAVAHSIAAMMQPGGRFVMFDVHAVAEVDALPTDLALATRLYETSVAVTHGSHRAGKWEAALRRAGLRVGATQDISEGILPGLMRMQSMSQQLLDNWARRLAIKAMPKYLVRNGIAALLGPLVFRLPKRNPDAALCYQKVVATKAAA